MKKPSFLIAVLAGVLAIGAAAVVLPGAAAQVQVGPSYVPIGAAASGSSSTAWFHHPLSGRVVACQTIPGAAASSPNSIQCVSASLP
jgi:hypothetical protein